jgi:acyl-CoA synthetase (AMP-forming)/AMP-acid ligase II
LGARGELLVRGPTIISQYYENPVANAAAFDSEGFFRTGDIVTCEDGPGITPATTKWYIIDRKKELIKVRGFQVSPSEIEAVILQHPATIDAAVIGIQADDPRDGENPRAYVVRQTEVTETEVKDWCAQRLAKYKSLTGGVVFVDAIPKNAGGKILKRILREQIQQEMNGSQSRPHL